MTKESLCVLVAVCCSAACGSVGGSVDAAVKMVDAPAPDSRTPTCDLNKPFGAPVLLSEINSAQNDDFVWLSPDELTVYVTSQRTGTLGDFDLWIATRNSVTVPFGALTAIAALDTAKMDFRPAVTADGLTMFFDSDRGTDAMPHIYVTTRASVAADFGAPSQVTAINQANTADTQEWINADGTQIIFSSNRPGGMGGLDLYQATRPNTSTPFGAPTAIAELNWSGIDEGLVLTADGLTIYFDSNRPGGKGFNDIYMASRTTTSDGFGTPVNLAGLNTAGLDWVSWLSADGCRLYGGVNLTAAAGGDDLWLATRPQ